MDKWYRADRALPAKSGAVAAITNNGTLCNTSYSTKWQAFNVTDTDPDAHTAITCEYWAYLDEVGPEGYKWTKEF